MKDITFVDLRGEDLIHGFEKGRFEPSVYAVLSISRDRRSRSIVWIGGV
jgi:hypothetical protein